MTAAARAAVADAAERILALATELGRRLRAQQLVLASAESCTAGGIGYAVTQVPGSSAWFDRGFITYSNAAKQQMLGVAAACLRDFGAVSEPVARAMAIGALTHSAAQISVAVTGIAGPHGGTPDKPVGTVCLAWAIRRVAGTAPRVRTVRLQFDGDRAAVRTQSIVAALDGLLDLLHTGQDIQPGAGRRRLRRPMGIRRREEGVR
jgi:nicotinamide-nucleotide amidase